MRKRAQEITKELLQSMFDYNVETGLFTRKIDWYKASAGEVCLCKMRIGYILIGVLGKRYLAHRLAFVYMTGAWPPEEVDHINGVRDDNRWCNLRLASKTENRRNLPKKCTNTSGIKGVRCKTDGRRKKWYATITVNRKPMHLGHFYTENEAQQAYLAAATEHFGNFART